MKRKLTLLACSAFFSLAFIFMFYDKDTTVSAQQRDIFKKVRDSPQKQFSIKNIELAKKQTKVSKVSVQAEMEIQKQEIIVQVNKLPPAERKRALDEAWKRHFTKE